MRHSAKDLATRDVVSRCMTMENTEGRGRWQGQRRHLPASRSLESGSANERLPGIFRKRQDLPPVSDVTREPIRCCDVHYNMAAFRPTTGAKCSTRHG